MGQDVVSAKARFNISLGQRPRFVEIVSTSSAESAIQVGVAFDERLSAR
jgi:hypothetical protein